MTTLRCICLLLFAAGAFITACQSQEPEEQQDHRLREFVAVQAIGAVEVHNFSGHRWLTAKELQDFKRRLGAMRYQPGGGSLVKSVDMGTTLFVLHARGRAYHLIGSPNTITDPTNQYLGIPNELATRNRDVLAKEDQRTSDLLLFKFSRYTNVHNYRKGPIIPERR